MTGFFSLESINELCMGNVVAHYSN